MASLFAAQDIHKHFGGIAALAATRFELAEGEVHALMGENGAGKSTLARICAGEILADAGRLFLNGQEISIKSPLDAQRRGIGIINQELDLFAHLSVGENLVIGNLRFPEKALVRQAAIERFCRPFLDQVGLDGGIDRWLAQLPVAQWQLLAIARALSMDCRILLMDEPTSALPDDATERLFEVIARLKAKGVAIVYVSHKMDEIFRLADRVTVLRDGKTIGTRDVAATSREELIRMMVGRDLKPGSRRMRETRGTVILSAAGLTTSKLKDVSFELRRGEVLGIAGLVGAGRSELGAALFGLDPIRKGRLLLKGEEFRPRAPSAAQQKGIGLVPEDRKRQGLMLQMSVKENSTFCVLHRLSRLGFIDKARESTMFAGLAQRLAMKYATADVAVRSLSGGNQQEALLARAIFADPDVLFLDDPARGIDVAAKEDVYRLIDDFAASGKSLLLASSELSELLRCADRILVLREGRVAGLFATREATQEKIMAAATRELTEEKLMPVRMKDIARDLGISPMAVSKALRDHKDIGRETKERVKKRAAELNYRMDWVARSMVTGRTYLVGLVVPDLMQSFFAEIASAITESLAPAGYHLLISHSGENAGDEAANIDLLMARKVDGLIIASAQRKKAAFLKLETPYVLIDREVPGLKANFVGSRNEDIGFLATSHLIAQGCRAIAHLRGPSLSNAEGRLKGYVRALSKRGLKALVEEAGHEDAGGYLAMKRLLAGRRRPDGIFCFNDPVATGAMRAILEDGLSIPKDIAIVGAANMHYADMFRIPLSTVDQDTRSMGREAARLLLKDMAAEDPLDPSRVIIPPKLILRASSLRR